VARVRYTVGVIAPTSRLARGIQDVHGDIGHPWLERLDDTLRACTRRWRLEFEAPHIASYSFVVAAAASGQPVVLKLAVPGLALEREARFLTLADGRGAVRLLEADLDRGALLLERAVPGTDLLALDDAAATARAAETMARLWRPAPADVFPTVADRADGLKRLRQRHAGGTGPIPSDLVALAERLFADLCATSRTALLLHGDLHHANVLSSTREAWLAIDPHGVVGDPAYELAALLCNPFPTPPEAVTLAGIEARRLEILRDVLGFETQRVAAWGCAHAVLSACWSLEDHGRGWQRGVAYARALAGLLV
jgi:streptomycin 6-kinase